MQATYTVRADDFPHWAELMKSAFRGKTLHVTVSDKLPDEGQETDTDEDEITDMADLLGMDETEYLMSTNANREYLLKAIQDVKEGKNLIAIENFDDLYDLEKMRIILEEHKRNQRENQ